MANLTKWAAGNGVGLTWTACFNGGSELASLSNTNTAVSTTTVISNGTALDLYADLSVSITSQTGTGTPLVAVYLLPLNQDGSTYADGVTSGSTAPVSNYYVGNIIVPASKAALSVVTGMLRGIILPPGTFKFAVQNQFGFTWNSTGHTIAYRTYNENLNG